MEECNKNGSNFDSTAIRNGSANTYFVAGAGVVGAAFILAIAPASSAEEDDVGGNPMCVIKHSVESDRISW